MTKFTRAQRQKIIEDFAIQNNGWYDPRAFLAHVRESGASHPAYDWFEWDNEAAAESHRLEQARDFARGLRISFEVQTLRRKPVTVSAPLMLSPLETRKCGGGYMQIDPSDKDHMQELRRQAARDLSWWLRRYEAVVENAGGELEALTRLQSLLAEDEKATAA